MHHADNSAATIGTAATATATTAAASLGFIEMWGIAVGAVSLVVSLFMAWDTWRFRQEQRKLWKQKAQNDAQIIDLKQKQDKQNLG